MKNLCNTLFFFLGIDLKILFFTFLFIGLNFSIYSQTKDWIGGTGNWDVSSNWNPAGVPVATDQVTIGAGGNTSIPAGVTAVAKSVTLSAGGNLTVAATGTLEINGSSLNGITMTGNGTTLSNEGMISIGNTSAISQSGIKMNDGAVFTNLAGGVLELNNVTTLQGIWMEDTGTQFNNSGLLKIGNTGPIKNWGIVVRYAAVFNNNSTATVELNNNVDNGGIYMEFSSAVNNSGIIKVGNLANVYTWGILVKSNCIFTNTSTGSVQIDRMVFNQAAGIRTEELGAFNNAGSIVIGSVSTLAAPGINVITGGTFTNTSSIPIEINNLPNSAAVEVWDAGSAFTNGGVLKIGNNTNCAGGIAISLQGLFNNNSGASIEINRITSASGSGVGMSQNGTFNNSGTLLIGNTHSIQNSGIVVNESTFTNNTTGQIEINNTITGNGITFTAGSGKTFTNAGSIKIGNLGPIKFTGVEIQGNFLSAGPTFNNNAGATLEINNVTDNYGMLVYNAASNNVYGFFNAGMLKIGNLTPVKKHGIYLFNGYLSNSANATIEINRTSTSGFAIYGGDPVSGFASLSNFGTIKMGNIASVWSGLYMEPNTTTINGNGALLEINNIPAFGNAITTVGNNQTPANFTNNGSIKVGNLSAVHEGINLNGNSTLGSSSTIEINNTSPSALGTRGLLIGQLGVCTNAGSIKIGNLSNVSAYGMVVAGSFTNNSSGVVEIDRVPNNGIGVAALSLASNCIFNNAGSLKLGTNASIRLGLHNNTGSGNSTLTNTGTVTFGSVNLSSIAGNVTLLNNAGGLVQTQAGGQLIILGTLVNNLNSIVLNAGTLTVFSGLGTLTNNGTITNNGTFTNSNVLTNNTGGVITNNAAFTNSSGFTLTNNGTFINNSLTLTNSGIFQLNGTLVLNTSPATLPGGTFNWNSGGTVKIGATGVMTVSSTLNVASGRFFEVEPFGTFTVSNTGQLVNFGTVSNYSTLFTNNNTLTNHGTLNNNAAAVLNNTKTWNNNGPFNNNGTLNNFSGGTFTNNSTLNNNGNSFFNNNSGATATNFSSWNNNASSSFTNNGTFNNGGAFALMSHYGNFTNNNSLVNNGFLYAYSGSTLTNNANLTGNVGSTLVIYSTLTNATGSNFTNHGSFTNDSGTVLNSPNATIVNNNTFVNISGSFTNNGTINNNGAVSNNNLGTMTNGNGSHWYNLNGATLNNNFGTFNNSAGSTLMNNTGASFNNLLTMNNAGALVNNGTLANSGQLTNQTGGSLDNNSTFNCNSGTLNNHATLNNNSGGALLNNPGCTLNNHPGAVFTNGGTITNSGSMNNSGNMNNSGSLQINTTSFLNNQMGGVINVGGTLNNLWSVNNLGTFTVDSGGVFVNGNTLDNLSLFTIENGGVLTNNGNLNNGNPDSSSVLLNNGTYQGAGIFYNNQGTLKGNGTHLAAFTNPANGIFAPGTSPGCYQFAQSFENQGLVEIEINSNDACSGFDQTTIVDTFYQGEILQINFGFTPSIGQSFTIIPSTTFIGSFSSINVLPANIEVSYSDGVVTVVSVGPLGCAVLNSPSNGASNVPANTSLDWATTSGASGFYLTIGTTPGGTDILNNIDLGNVTNYDPPGLLPYGTTIYVKIVPYNLGGPASGCVEQSFTTGNCIANLTISNTTVEPGIYKSLGEMTAWSATVITGTDLTFRSDTAILLDYDFTTELGAIFTMEIMTCP